MKKFILVSGLFLYGLSLSAANSSESQLISTIRSTKRVETKETFTKEKVGPEKKYCEVCYVYPTGKVCSVGETCADAETAVRLTLGLEC